MVKFRATWRLASRYQVIIAAALVLGACSSLSVEPPSNPGDRGATARDQSPSRVAGDGGFSLFSLGGTQRNQGGGASGGIGVNSYLWRASLDTVAFMPLASADPFGGVIITDWYSPPESPEERFKVMVYIFGGQLRADGVRAQVFRQRRGGAAVAAAPGRNGRPQQVAQRPATGDWLDVTVESNVTTELENAILTRARQLRIDAGGRS